MDSELGNLISERDLIKASLTRFNRYFKDPANLQNIRALQKRLNTNAGLYEKYDSIQCKIERIVAGQESEASHAADRDAFEENYYSLIASVEEYIENANSPPTRQTVSSPTMIQSATPTFSNAPPAVTLPMIQLPTFDGNYDHWIKFRDTFTSLIHTSELSDVKKFHYLNSALKGPAARVIESLGVSEVNYKAAWEALNDQYENSKALRKHHVFALLDLPPIKGESPTALRDLMYDARGHLTALKSLEEPVESWDTLIIPIITRKLDSATFREWERSTISLERVTFKRLARFLQERITYLESIVKSTQVSNPKVESQFVPSGGRRPMRVTTHVASKPMHCPACESSHLLYQCDKFKTLTIEERTKMVLASQACYNCLQTGHRVQACTRRHCTVCGKRHHTLLHRDTRSFGRTAKGETTVAEPEENLACVSNVATKSIEQTILSTAVVFVKDKGGRRREIRALLDSGSQVHFITNACCKKLGIRLRPFNTRVTGLGRMLNSIKGKVDLRIFSRINNFQEDISCLTIEKITDDMPNVSMDGSSILPPSHIELADPQFNKCGPIDMLIGVGLFWRLLSVGQHKAGTAGLLWQKTQLGWVLGGQLSLPCVNQPSIKGCHIVTNNDLRNQLERFWHVEEVDNRNTINRDECEIHFQGTTQRDEQGRYVVSIPFNDIVQTLGSSREQAEIRFRSLERRFRRQPELREQYVTFMKEYEELGHMSKIRDSDLDRELAYYLPHHAVIKEDSTTTKIRVVFDGSAKSTTGISLNDSQRVGPTIQSDLFSILLRFRTHKYVLSADIAKMYRQILVEPTQRRFQRILWRSNIDNPIETFELNTVTYGTASAPFLATRVLHQVGLDCAQESPSISRIIINDFYVDDLLTGLETASEVKQTKEALTHILERAGFKLRKWATNCPFSLNSSGNLEQNKELNADKDPKILGLQWSSATDELTYKVIPSYNKRVTKRNILSEIAQIFDPLGLLSPVVTTAKLIMQQLWQVETGWDESVPQTLFLQWIEFRNELHHLTKLKIPRRALVNLYKVELHGFSDASERAYGACIYLRSRVASAKWQVKLLCAKSRVAPLKTQSIPRLELCGALLLAQLVQKVRAGLSISICKEWYWCDSTITLAWIRGASTRWKTFVANRVSQIQMLTSTVDWSHVQSHDNPADLISRGTSPSRLENSPHWWSGPAWLGKEPAFWPISIDEVPSDRVPEERKQEVAAALTVDNTFEIYDRFSDYTRLLRTTAYCLRFASNARKLNASKDRQPDIINLTATELQEAQERLIKLSQTDTFSDEISLLKNNQPMPKGSSLRTLAPFLDPSGLIRVGGRLKNAPITFEKKHPLILPSKHPLTRLIIAREHNRLLHAGCQQVTASLREQFWPISCTRTVKGVIRNCVRCFRAKPHTVAYPMGQLPASRVTPARPFTTCGVDYAGPFTTKDRTRSKVKLKAYICVFVCFATKAIHIELATDLSTDAFINCLKRFIARRGRCKCIVSDNGTNFIGTRNRFNDLGILLNNKEHNSRIHSFLSDESIDWKLSPPHAPHFGGLWESAVRLTKHHLSRVIGEQILTYEELYTLLTQVESCLNSRPLCPLSADPTDLNPLTPGHFLIGDALTSIPEQDVTDRNTHRLNRYQLVQQMFQHFWKRWQKEYIHQLQQRYKWTSSPKRQLSEGTLVLIKEDNLPPLRWSLARITHLHPGADGVTRVVTVKTADGHYKRPVTKLCILPMHDTTDGT